MRRFQLCADLMVVLLAFVASGVSVASPLATIACPLPSTNKDLEPVPDASQPSGVPMSFVAPTTSLRLKTLDIVQVGLSLDVYRQGQAWAQLQKQNSSQSNALHVGTALPIDPNDYPIDATLKNMAWQQRKSNALELALRSFPERWPLPTITVVRNYNPKAERLRRPPEYADEWLNEMASLQLGDAGLHWNDVNQLKNGVICNNTPEAVIEKVFEVFERYPDMPALLLYVVEGYNMALTLMSHPEKPIGLGTGPRQPGELTDSVLARLHRPVTVSLYQADKPSVQLKGPARDQAIANGWDQATTALGSVPARAFFDTGKPSGAIAVLAPALLAAQQPLDLLDSSQSYDLSQRLGDTGAASPFVGLALATMASYLNADSSLVVPLRQDDRATFIGVSPPVPGKIPADDPFGVRLRQ